MKYINLLIILLLIGCGENSSEKKTRLREEKAQLQKEQKASAKAQLISYYKPVVGWDSTEVFTYWYQENLCGEQKKIYFEGAVNDIIKVDSTDYIVSVYKGSSTYDKAFIIECRISEKMKAAIGRDFKQGEGVFIAEIDTVENRFKNVFDEKLISLKGTLIDFRLYEN